MNAENALFRFNPSKCLLSKENLHIRERAHPAFANFLLFFMCWTVPGSWFRLSARQVEFMAPFEVYFFEQEFREIDVIL